MARLTPTPTPHTSLATRQPLEVAPSDHQQSKRPRGPASGTTTVLQALPIGDSVRILRVARPDGWTFQPGQHLKLGLAGQGQHPYSIASAPHELHLEFCIERVPGGALSPRLFILRPGDPVELGQQAKGSLRWAQDKTVHLVIATVTGIAPFRSLILDAMHGGQLPGKVIVLHGASHAHELPYHDELSTLAARDPQRLQYLATVSRAEAPQNQGFQGGRGRVDALAQQVAAPLSGRSDVHVYACGHPGMVESVKRMAEALDLTLTTESFA